MKALGLSSFVAFDVETTGLDPLFERMIEVAAVRFRDGVETERYTSFIACPTPLPPFIVKLTNITDEMLKGQPTEEAVIPELLDFIGDDPIAGQNVSFDLGFLRAAVKRINPARKLDNRAIDTALLARALIPTLPSKGLASLARYFNLDNTVKHRAEADARRCGQVLLSELSYFPRVDIKTVDLLRRAADGSYHVSAWIFHEWANYLIQTSSVEGKFAGHQIPYLTDNIIGKLPSGLSVDVVEAEGDEADSYECVDVKVTRAFFNNESPLRQVFDNYEHRPQQEEMAEAVSSAFNQGRLLAVEAGTGVGKSMAYLVPAIYWAQANRDVSERVIISTNTKNLQEQLFFKDLPALVKVSPVEFSAVLQKGRNNYLCRRRYNNLVNNYPIRIPPNEKLALLGLILWAEQTRAGDVSEVGGMEGRGALWSRIASEAGSCRGRRCRERNRCFHARVRQAAAKAHLVVVNHSLLMADIAANRAPIGAYNTLIVDEAHHLEKAAAQHLGRELNSWITRGWCNRTYDAETAPTGLLAQILLGMGAARTDHAALPSLTAVVEFAAVAVAELRRTADEFFAKLTEVSRQKAPVQDNSYTQKLRLREPDLFLQEVKLSEGSLEDAIAEALERFGKISESLADIPAAALPQAEDWIDDLRGAVDELAEVKLTLKFFQAPADLNWVYWVEVPQKEEHTAILYAAPLNAGDILREALFDPLRAGVMTSATLTVADRFHYFLRKVGLKDKEDVETLKLGSPFDYNTQMFIGLPAFLPSPKERSFEPEVVQLLHNLVRDVNRGTLGLFTSYRMLRSVGRSLEAEKIAERLLIQGQHGSRDHLLRQFREEPGSVLLGTDSFWEGIDVVGEALELLIVAKLPFEVPSEPIVEARYEKLKAEGKDAFMYYTVPEAIIRLRQGIGRLIRSKTDRGAALILDSRLHTTRYGKAFLESLPAEVKILKSPEETISAIQKFFNQ
ncbi:DEAD/DEAH box helicase family protein [bacterium]|nr:DEAD/DEAH box helicase family protein [bacterium]MBU1652180.1 DEAD/DEAH box helicase family protein [bacterium]